MQFTNDNLHWCNVLKGKGGLGPTIFKITIDSKGPHILWRQHSGHDHFPQNRTKSAKNYHTMIYHHPSIDNSILSFQKISPIGEKWLSYDQKTYAQIWACKSYLAHNINIFQRHQVYSISTIKLHILCKFKYGLYGKKPIKNNKMGLIPVRYFRELRITF